MKVRELVEKLKNLDGELEVICITEDEELLPKNLLLRLLEITDVVVTEAETYRNNEQVPSLRIVNSPASQKYVVIEVTADC